MGKNSGLGLVDKDKVSSIATSVGDDAPEAGYDEFVSPEYKKLDDFYSMVQIPIECSNAFQGFASVVERVHHYYNELAGQQPGESTKKQFSQAQRLQEAAGRSSSEAERYALIKQAARIFKQIVNANPKFGFKITIID